MPYIEEWVEPEVALKYKGVTVYHTYEDQRLDTPELSWYTLDPALNEDDAELDAFNIGGLQAWAATAARHPNLGLTDLHQAVLKAAIDSGELKAPRKPRKTKAKG